MFSRYQAIERCFASFRAGRLSRLPGYHAYIDGNNDAYNYHQNNRHGNNNLGHNHIVNCNNYYHSGM